MSSDAQQLHKGRPREFDTDEALEKAMRLFWEKGYEGTSLTDLTEAMGINRPSIYAAFGGKEELFRKVLDRYARGPAGFFDDALQAPSWRSVVERLLTGSIAMLTSPNGPGGCLAVQAALSCGDEADPIRRELIAWRDARETALSRRFEEAQAAGDLPGGSDPTDLARYIMTVLQGLSVQASSGASADDLQRVASMTLAALPTR